MKKMKEDVLVSIIIPIYNAERYLGECIDSLLVQTYKNIEIILVNDGSEDETEKCCKRYVNLDSRIKYFYQRNKGQNSARYLGLSNSSGELITFVDADDIVKDNLIEILVDALEENLCDMVLSGVYKWYGDKLEENNMLLCGLYSGREIALNVIDHNHFYQANVNTSLYANLFRKEIIKKVFNSLDLSIDFSEDVISVILACFCSQKVLVLKEYMYYQRMHEDSFTNKHEISNIESQKKLFYFSRLINRKWKIGDDFEREIDYLIIRDLLIGGYEIFCNEESLFPYVGVKPKTQIIIYGAGAMGKELIKYIEKYKNFSICGVIDQNLFGNKIYDYTIKKIEEIDFSSIDYDYLIIANSKEIIANEIMYRLTNIGIESKKIKTISKQVVDSQNLEKLFISV